MSFQKAEQLKKSLIPKDGYNVVAVDPFEMPWEALYLVGHFTEFKDAEVAQTEKTSKGIKAFIYDKDTK